MNDNNNYAGVKKSPLGGWGLLLNNLLISIRHLKADKINSIISISGLILGLGIVAIVLVFVLNELGYNSSFANRKQIYRVLNHNIADNNTWANTPFIIG